MVGEIGSEAQGGGQCLEQGNKLVCGRDKRRLNLEHLFCDQPHSALFTNCTNMCTFIMRRGYHRAHKKVRQLCRVSPPLCVCGL